MFATQEHIWFEELDFFIWKAEKNSKKHILAIYAIVKKKGKIDGGGEMWKTMFGIRPSVSFGSASAKIFQSGASLLLS